MRKVILNKCYGGFDVSEKAYQLYAKKKGLELYKYEYDFDGNYLNKKIKLKRIEKSSLLGQVYLTKDFGERPELLGEDFDKYHLYLRDSYREDPTLIEVVEELGEKASGLCGRLVVVEIPDDLDYVIDEYDGLETLHERVQEW